MKELFTTAPALAWSVVSVLTAALVVALLWEKVKWWWHNTWYSLPLIGKIASLSHDINQAQEPGWFKSERTLCRDYKKFIRIQDEHDFDEKITYLTKAGDLGRSVTPALIWLLTIAMVYVEAMGFSYVLAGYTLPGASENLQQIGAYGIAFLISVILVAFTHFAGHELYVSSKIKQARREWAEDNRSHKLKSDEVPLARSQSLDDGQPAYTQLSNRVGIHPSYKITAATVLFVVIVAVFATYVRGQVLEQQLIQNTTGQDGAGGGAKPDGLDLSQKLPSEDVNSQGRADKKAGEDLADTTRHGGWGTFIVLAFVFVFLQLLGVIFGFRWGFAGKQSEKAYNAIGKGSYATYGDVREHYQQIADMAQSKLEHLQQQLMDRNATVGTSGKHTSKTFRDFMEEERAQQTRERLNEREHVAQRLHMEQMGIKPAALKADSSLPLPTALATASLSQPLTLESALEHLEQLGDKQAKTDYLATLPAELEARVIHAIKQSRQQAQAEEAVRRQAERDNLFD